MNTIFSYAAQYLKSGFSTIPIKVDGSKSPAVSSWAEYQKRKPSESELMKWFGNGASRGIAVIGGKVSGGLEILDFDSPDIIPAWRKLVEEEAPDLLTKLPQVETPSGGLHVYFRCAIMQGNQKLAEREIEVPATTPGAYKRGGNFFKNTTLIETRGEGGYVLAPGSPPECHEFKKPYQLINGTLAKTPVITVEEREILFVCARQLNELVKKSDQIAPERAPKSETKRPGEDFNARGDVRGLLEKNGWQFLRKGSKGGLWARPGVNHISASLYENGFFHIFSTNAHPLENGCTYSPFALYATLEHESDFSAAAKALAAKGYGEQKEKKGGIGQGQQAGTDQAKSQESNSTGCLYEVNGVGLVWLKRSAESEKPNPIPLTNFTAEIIGDVSRDDGAEQTRIYEIAAQLAGENTTRKGTVRAEEFDPLRWINTILGAKAIVYPGKKEHTAVAIRAVSQDIKTRYVIAHTGWRDGIYYHGGGAIGAGGLIEAEVDLPTALAPCVLQDPPIGEPLRAAVRSVFGLLGLAPDEIIIAHFGAVLAAVLGDPDFSTFLFGYTNSGKSELAALAQAFFGAGFHAKNLPASWSSTANALEGLAHTVKDCVLVVDDFCPLGNAADQARFHAAADRVLRAQGNHSGRIRCRTDGSVRPVKAPRGLIISTGEDVPRGQSLRTRLFVVEVPKDALNWDKLTECQAAAREGIYASVTSAYLQWLATDGRIAEIQAKAAEEIGEYRETWLASKTASVKRIASTLAQLTRAWRTFLGFALDCGAITQAEVDQLWIRVEAALEKAGGAQTKFQASENPATRFIELVQASLTSGKAHIAAIDGGQPNDRELWGWLNGEAQGDRIGWIDGEEIYLQPDAAFSIAQRMASGGEGLTVTSQTLWKRLKEAGYLASTDTGRDTLKVRRRIGGRDQGVMHISAEKFQ